MKSKILYLITPLTFVILATFIYSFSISSPISYPSQPSEALTKYGIVCYSTTGDFEGRKTPAHKGIVETIGCNENLVVDAGLNAIKDILGQGSSFGAFDYIALCNATASCNTPQATDTNLENEFTTNGLARTQGTYTSNGVGNWSISHTFTSSGVSGLETNKTCLFNQSSQTGDTMFACNTFNKVTLDGTSGDTLTINWTNFVQSA